MTNNNVPAWLLQELFLTSGAFTDDTRTAVIGQPNPHLGAVLNTGRGTPSVTKPIRLNDAQLKRLAGEQAQGAATKE